MFKGIDHLVIVVNDLRQAATDYEKLGFTVVPGGKHPVGSHNMLISFSDGSYLELIGFYRDATDHRWWQPLQTGERLVDYCLQTDDLQGDTRKLRAAGVAINDPVPWSRTRPDGYELKWILSLATGSHRGFAPFLIQDVTPREERIPREFEHQNGTTGIDTVTIAVDEVSQVDRWYSAVLARSGKPMVRTELGAEGLAFSVGQHTLEFLKASNASSPLINWIRTYGPSPYSATLHSRVAEAKPLEQSLTHGAQLYFKAAE